MSDTPDSHAFPAAKLGDFLRAMEDPEGKGDIDPEREREITRIEERIAGGSQDEPRTRSDDG